MNDDLDTAVAGVLLMNPKVSSYVERQKKWKAESEQLRAVALEFPLEEELKWGKPCYSMNGKNVVLIQGFREYIALLFFKGALLADPKGLLVPPGNSQAARQLRFTSPEEVNKQRTTIKAYVKEAMAVESAGLKVKLKEHSEYSLPQELEAKLNATPELKRAFEALTPGRQRSYMLHIAGAKQAKTRWSRVEKCVPTIMEGKGFNE